MVPQPTTTVPGSRPTDKAETVDLLSGRLGQSRPDVLRAGLPGRFVDRVDEIERSEHRIETLRPEPDVLLLDDLGSERSKNLVSRHARTITQGRPNRSVALSMASYQ